MNYYSYLFYVFNCYASIPTFMCAIYRLLHQGYYSKSVYLPQSTKLDYIFRLLISPLAVYYTVDTVVLLIQIERMDWCGVSFFLHHIITLMGTPFMMLIPHYPWYIMATFAWHTFLVTLYFWPVLNYGYLTLAVITAYGLNQQPWIKINPYRMSLYTLYALFVLPVPMLWYFECQNDLQHVE